MKIKGRKERLETVHRSGAGPLRAKLDLLSDHFSDAILLADTDPIALLRDTVVPSGRCQGSCRINGFLYAAFVMLMFGSFFGSSVVSI
jgi:hypothetical protein